MTRQETDTLHGVLTKLLRDPIKETSISQENCDNVPNSQGENDKSINN